MQEETLILSKGLHAKGVVQIYMHWFEESKSSIDCHCALNVDCMYNIPLQLNSGGCCSHGALEYILCKVFSVLTNKWKFN